MVFQTREYFSELLLDRNKRAVSSGGSAVHVVRAAEPVGLRAAASRAGSLIRTALPEKMSFLLDLMDCTLDIFTFYIQGLTFKFFGQIYNRNCY